MPIALEDLAAEMFRLDQSFSAISRRGSTCRPGDALVMITHEVTECADFIGQAYGQERFRRRLQGAGSERRIDDEI